MEKKLIYRFLSKRKQFKCLLVMKLFAVFSLVLCLNISASTYGQNERLTLCMENVSLEEVFKAVEKRTDYTFLYRYDYINKVKKQDVNYKNEKLSVILTKCLKESGLTYKLQDKTVVIINDKIREVERQQSDKKLITGKVVDQKGEALPGVAVIVQGTNIGTATDARGRFKIKASPNDVLRFSFVGMKTYVVLVEDKEKIDVKLFSDTEQLDEVQVVAFGEQKKESVVSSITSVSADALKSSNSDLTSQFAGKIAGIIGLQTGGAPGALTEDEMNTKFYIRGITSYQTGANIDPLILLDGIEVSKLDLARIDPDDIESFNVLKDATATAMYGSRAANGVIYVKTKKGKEGSVRTTFRYERIYSSPTERIEVVGGQDYMRLYNEALVGRNSGVLPKYTQDDIDKRDDDGYPEWVYPNNDWYDVLFKDVAVNNHFNLNVRGGSRIMQYYVSVTHNNDKGLIQTANLNDFNANIVNKQTSFRMNVNIDLNKSSKLTLNSFTTYDNYHGPLNDVNQAYALAYRANPVDFAPVYPPDDEHNWPHTMYGGAFSLSTNPFAAINNGYKDRIRYSTVNKFEYIQSLSRFVKGLELRAVVGLSKSGYFQNGYVIGQNFYKLDSYNPVTGEHKLIANDISGIADKISKHDGYDIRTSTTTMDYQFTMLHTAAWGNHQTGLTGVFTARQIDNGAVSGLLESFPQRNLGFSFRANYGYKDKWFIEGSFAINGSERFANGNKFGIFPAVGGAWVVSNEDFMRGAENWMSYLKLRLSYGITGNDGVINNPRFLYLQELGGNTMRIGYPNIRRAYSYVVNYGKENTEWETNKEVNIGLDGKMFKGLIEFNLDAYRRVRDNIYDVRRTIPLAVGLYSNPLDNFGTVEAKGFEASLKIQHAFSPDFWFILNNTFTYNKSIFKNVEEATGKQDWQKKVGHDISQQYCYIAEGLFKDYEEIRNSPYQAGDVMPGDIRYRDVDDNGVIDVNDAVMAGYPETPRIIYGFNLMTRFKNFEFSMAFQGSGQRGFFLDPKQLSPFYDNNACLKAIADDHWTELNNENMPFWPRLSTNNIVEHNPQEDYYNSTRSEVRKSTYFLRSCQFLRCTSMELSYYIDKDFLKKYKIENFKLFARTNNPFIISNFDLWDIELGGNGFNYPIQKTYSLGLNFSF